MSEIYLDLDYILNIKDREKHFFYLEREKEIFEDLSI